MNNYIDDTQDGIESMMNSVIKQFNEDEHYLYIKLINTHTSFTVDKLLNEFTYRNNYNDS